MRSFGLRDVLGPIMVGPSSSHTAGALRIAQMVRELLDAPPAEVRFTLYGSFARTYRGHGTDRALAAGMLGLHTDDLRIRDSLQFARDRGLAVSFEADPTSRVSHPNTVDVWVRDANGDELTARGESIGGGAARLTMIDGLSVQITGEYNALILYERDVPGVLGHIAGTLGEGGVNIGSVWMYRSRRGGEAFNVLEVDGPVSREVREAILASPDISRMRFVPVDGLGRAPDAEGLGEPSMGPGEAERLLPTVDFEDASQLLSPAARLRRRYGRGVWPSCHSDPWGRMTFARASRAALLRAVNPDGLAADQSTGCAASMARASSITWRPVPA
jgi:L-serine dehydratase